MLFRSKSGVKCEAEGRGRWRRRSAKVIVLESTTGKQAHMRNGSTCPEGSAHRGRSYLVAGRSDSGMAGHSPCLECSRVPSGSQTTTTTLRSSWLDLGGDPCSTVRLHPLRALSCRLAPVQGPQRLALVITPEGAQARSRSRRKQIIKIFTKKKQTHLGRKHHIYSSS